MFESLSERLSGVFDKLTKQGALSEDDVSTALREVRVALLEADVSLPVARNFIKAVQEKAAGQSVTKSVTPGQHLAMKKTPARSRLTAPLPRSSWSACRAQVKPPLPPSSPTA